MIYGRLNIDGFEYRVEEAIIEGPHNTTQAIRRLIFTSPNMPGFLPTEVEVVFTEQNFEDFKATLNAGVAVAHKAPPDAASLLPGYLQRRNGG